MKATKQAIDALYSASESAYSFDSYKNWRGVCAYLLRRGFTHDEANCILMSKWTRWAGDASETRTYGNYTSTDLANFIDKMGDKMRPQLDEMMKG